MKNWILAKSARFALRKAGFATDGGDLSVPRAWYEVEDTTDYSQYENTALEVYPNTNREGGLLAGERIAMYNEAIKKAGTDAIEFGIYRVRYAGRACDEFPILMAFARGEVQNNQKEGDDAEFMVGEAAIAYCRDWTANMRRRRYEANIKELEDEIARHRQKISVIEQAIQIEKETYEQGY